MDSHSTSYCGAVYVGGRVHDRACVRDREPTRAHARDRVHDHAPDPDHDSVSDPDRDHEDDRNPALDLTTEDFGFLKF
jgi:hypothetical protein